MFLLSPFVCIRDCSDNQGAHCHFSLENLSLNYSSILATNIVQFTMSVVGS